MPSLRIGTTLGRYRLDALVGEGGMAQVYRAHDLTMDRTVAVKVIHPHLATDPLFIERFLREVRAVTRLQHPHILPIFDFGQEQGIPFLVTPLVNGGTLADRLAAPHTSAEIVALLRPVAAALDYAHRSGVVHRDVKPANILLTSEGEPLLADFGIAKVLGDSSLTASGSSIGSVLYMAPEQAQGQPLDGRADLYALGVILYEALAGQPPFRPLDSDTPFSLALRMLSTPSPPARSLNPSLPVTIEPVLSRALSKSPEERYRTGVAFITDAEVALRGELPFAKTVTSPSLIAPTQLSQRPTPSDVSRTSGRSALWALYGAVIAMLLLGAVGFVLVGSGRVSVALPDWRAATATNVPPLALAPTPTPSTTMLLATPTRAMVATAQSPTETLVPTATRTPIPTPTSTVPPTSTPNVFLSEYFTGRKSGWSSSGYENATQPGYYSDYGDGYYVLRAPASNTTLSNVHGVDYLTRRDFADFTLEVTTNWATSVKDGAYGVTFRASSTGGYTVMLNATGFYKILKFDGKSSSAIITDWTRTFNYRSGTQPNTLSISCQGPRCTLAINGAAVTSFVDVDHQSGGIALIVHAWAESVEARFTYVRIGPP